MRKGRLWAARRWVGAIVVAACWAGPLGGYLAGVSANSLAPSPASGAAGESSRPSVRPVLRVAAGSDNLPFSNQRRGGFENRIAELIARRLGADIEYVWRPQRHGIVRATSMGGGADLVLGVPVGLERALTTAPYYRSSYVLVSREDRGISVRSWDDPALRRLRFAMPSVKDDGVRPEPAELLDAVVDGRVDVAAVWAPLAEYFARRSAVRLTIQPVAAAGQSRNAPFAYDVSMAVARGNRALRDRIDQALRHESAAIERILEDYGVPRLPLGS